MPGLPIPLLGADLQGDAYGHWPEQQRPLRIRPDYSYPVGTLGYVASIVLP